MALKKSLYEIAEHRLDETKHTGFKYQGKVLRNSLSSFIYKDDTRAEMLDSLEPVVTQMIESVKYIKNMLHFAVGKNYKGRN